MGALRDACHSFGLTFGVWEAFPSPGSGAQAVAATGADHYVAQAEQQQDWQAIVGTFRSDYPNVPAAVVTNFWGIGDTGSGYDPTISAPVIDAGFYCLTEAYVVANPNATPARLDFTATEQLGWPKSQPVIGCFDGFPASRYVAEHDLAAWPGYFVWLAETLTDADWQALRAINL